jgi:hypothetical protein
MRNRILIIALSLYVSASYADTCPPAQSINPQTPPAGWTLFMSPLYAGENYYFVQAVHSLNANYYFQQVFCTYQTCPSFSCPTFTLLSNVTYQFPNSNNAPWNTAPPIVNTIVCFPKNNDPLQCVFANG